ncbi:apolipoprotein F-like [Chionomys nivalis]|uniref:apolipoprotein F-like n=1 Tax=Chionomys nivalis TaxID=269649 RepID=UPI0025959D01|nr:apolipoprotein F-like [Chionomys nivalis]
MIQAALLLACVLLSSVVAFPRNAQNGALPVQPAVRETESTSNVLSGKILPPAPGTCQVLLNTVPSLAPLPEHLSLLALKVALEDVGCPAEAQYLQLQLSEAGGEDDTESLVLQSQMRSKEEVLRGLGGFPGELKRVRRSGTLPETCTDESAWVLHESASFLAELAEKFPSIDVVSEFKASVANVTQQCTIESWEHLEEVRIRMMKSPEIKNATLSIEDKIYFTSRLAVLLKRVFMSFLLEYFWSYFG